MNTFMLILLLATAPPDIHKTQIMVSNLPSMQACQDLQKIFHVGLTVEDTQNRDAIIQTSTCVKGNAT